MQVSRGSVRAAGLGIAATIAVLFAGVVMYFGWRQRSGPAPATVTTTVPAAPDITQLPSSAGGPLRQLGGGSGMHIQMIDSKDPTRIAGIISAAKSTPLEGKRYRLEEPVVWWFLKDGRVMHVKALRGEALIPDFSGSRPEDGIVEGDVVISLFAPGADGARPDPLVSTPALQLKTQQLRFDGRSGEMRFPGPLEVRGARVEFDGSDALIVMNEGAERLELLRIEKTTRMVIHSAGAASITPRATGSPVAGNGEPPPSAGPGTGGGITKPAAIPVETNYAAWCEGGVRVEQGKRSLTGERLEGWFRLFDNQLRTGAIAEVSGAKLGQESHSTAGHAATAGPLSTAPGAAPVTAAAPVAGGEGAGKGSGAASDTTLAWNGPLEVRPIEPGSSELAINDVFVRCTSTRAGGVSIRDEAAGASGTGAMVEYGATRRFAAIQGGKDGVAELVKPGAGVAKCRGFEVQLSDGRIHAIGGGSLASTDGGPGVREISWTTEAEFALAMEEGRMSSLIKRADLHGGVKAGDGKGMLSGEAMTAEFGAARGTSVMERLTVLGSAKAEDGKDSALSSDSLVVDFAKREDSTSPDPHLVTARGHVRGRQKDASLAAETLVATLERRDGKSPVVVDAKAEGNVEFERADGVHARASKLDADPINQIVKLRGEHAAVGQTNALIQGTAIDLDGLNKRLKVDGAGTIDTKTDDPAGEAAHVAWTERMGYDDVSGIAICEGDASAELKQALLSKDSLKASRVEVGLAVTAGDKADNGKAGLQTGHRQVTSVVAMGNEAAPAKVESRRYEPLATGGQGALAKLLYLEGAQIHADNVQGVLKVPGEGKLLALDKSATGQQASQGSGDVMKQPPRGTALFVWKGGMEMERRRGTATMRDHVHLTHEPLAGEGRVEMDCEELTAQVMEEGAASATLQTPFTGEFKSATASGSVWMRYMQKELTGDMMTYDASARRVEALGRNGNTVTAFDPANASPVTAERVLWDLAENRFQLLGIQQPVVTPR